MSEITNPGQYKTVTDMELMLRSVLQELSSNPEDPGLQHKWKIYKQYWQRYDWAIDRALGLLEELVATRTTVVLNMGDLSKANNTRNTSSTQQGAGDPFFPWPSGFTLLPYALNILLLGGTEYNINSEQGVSIELAYPSNVPWYQTTITESPLFDQGTGGSSSYQLNRYIPLEEGIRINPPQSVNLAWENHTGQTISCTVRIFAKGVFL